MHASALVDLLYAADGGKSLQRSISLLQTAARLTDRPAPVLADLAAVYLVRAARGGTPRDLAAAIEAAAEALEREPENRAARYNLALALHRWGLVEEAAEAWRGYLVRDRASGWAGAARGHLLGALTVEAPPPPPAPNAPPERYAAFAAADPQGGAKLGWCTVLGRWAAAVRERDAKAAEAELARAEALGGALRDRGLSDAVRAIREGGRSHTDNLSAAHRELAAGCQLHDRAEFAGAMLRFAAADTAAGASPVLRAWAKLSYGSMAFYRGDRITGKRIFAAVALGTDTLRYPALAGRARLMYAALLLRGDEYDEGLVQAARAVPLFARAGEGENEGAALDAMSGAQFGRRDMDEGYTLSRRALHRLRPYRASYRLHNLLAVNAQVLADDGLRRAAIRMQDEGVRVASRNGAPAFVAEAYLARARLRAGMGDLAGAQRDASTGYRVAATISDPDTRGWMTAQWRMVAAATSLRGQPAGAAEALDSAAAFFLGLSAPLVALPAVVAGAEARLAAGNAQAARTRLESALGMLEHRRNSVRMEPRRAAVFETARGVVDRITSLELAAGHPVGALAYLDRGRATLAAVGTASPAAAADVSAPPGEVVLVFSTLGDTLLAWTITGQHVELYRHPMDTRRLVRTVETLRQVLQVPATEQEVRPALAWLYELLIRPVADRLGASGTPLVIVADGAVASAPFAALYDARRGKYLVQDRPIRFAPSLQVARRPARRPVGQALLVADPAFDEQVHRGFERLVGADGEVRDVSTLYQGRSLLSGRHATEAALRTGLGRAGVVHYAGHAVFDDERPERSYLLLAPSAGDPDGGTLDAQEIAGLNLGQLSVVVLSACQTVRTGPGRAGGFSGLAGAFLAAGAGGAVGSLWDVSDVRTRPLMVAFHEAYRRGGSGPAALRSAQLHLLQSTDEALRSPATWAAFRYVGS